MHARPPGGVQASAFCHTRRLVRSARVMRRMYTRAADSGSVRITQEEETSRNSIQQQTDSNHLGSLCPVTQCTIREGSGQPIDRLHAELLRGLASVLAWHTAASSDRPPSGKTVPVDLWQNLQFDRSPEAGNSTPLKSLKLLSVSTSCGGAWTARNPNLSS